MRRTALRILFAITLLAAVAPVEAAPNREPLIVEPNDLPGGDAPFCGFPVHIDVVSNNAFQDVTTLEDGTTITRTTGRQVQSFTNVDTGFTIVRNVSGPTLRIDNPDGTGTFIVRGLNWFIFGPISQANTGEAPLVFTAGRVVLEFHGNIVDSFTLTGRKENLCELLAP